MLYLGTRRSGCFTLLGGGKGAVREMIDEVVKRENLSEEFLKLWL